MVTVDLKRLKIAQGMMVLDVGCGTGRHTCAVSRCCKNMVIGTDIDFNALKETRRRLVWERKLGVQRGSWALVVSDVGKLPFKDEYFDLVICSEVMEHIVDQETAISELVRVLKPGCDMVISVPRYFPERICWAISKEYNSTTGGHVRIYRAHDIVKSFERKGLQKWALHFAHGLHSPYWWLKCIVGVHREDSRLVNLYHKFLVWDMMKSPWITKLLEKILNPLIGKSAVFYFRKVRNA